MAARRVAVINGCPLGRQAPSTIEEELQELSPRHHVAIIEWLEESELFASTKLPRETHHRKEQETVVEEHVVAYRLIKVLASSELKSGERIWVIASSRHRMQVARAFHERGVMKSPVIQVRKPQHPPEGTERLVVLYRIDRSTPVHPAVYSIVLEEGVAAEPEVQRILRRRA